MGILVFYAAEGPQACFGMISQCHNGFVLALDSFLKPLYLTSFFAELLFQ